MGRLCFAVAGLLMIASACTKDNAIKEECRVEVVFDTGRPGSKSADPSDEDAINDVNIFVFNSLSGLLETHVYLDRKTYGKQPLGMNLLTNVRYNVAACLNCGYRLPDIKSMDELPTFRYYMVYPDDYSAGMPMAAYKEGFVPGKEEGPLVLQATRLLAKIYLTIDRSALNSDVTMTVAEAEIGGCPRSITPFSASKPEGKNDVFSKGFYKKGIQADNLNRDNGGGKSGEVCLYMFESINSAVSPYIQLRLNYLSRETSAGNGKWLYYRFYIGEKEGNTDIKRNTRYHFTVFPHGTGIEGNPSWKVVFTD